jgi:hypothetical protein
VHGSELASIDAAIRAATTKVETARAAVAVELQKLNALKLRAASRAFAAHMRKLDKALGLTIPSTLLVRADEIIE